MLTDGLRGPRLTYSYNWLGFEGEECEAIVDLGDMTEVKNISSSWLQDVRSWVFYPQSISYFGSGDGESWALLGEVFSEQDPANEGVNVQDFIFVSEKTIELRYLKIKSKSFIECPKWHPGSSSPAWIFTDEITVN